ncbi:MAG: PelD GGDEF domain-containing protein [Moraxellaceae bacterium]|nr:PelD GGDEF domain-containing protein [Moraxellaceae bacterium]
MPFTLSRRQIAAFLAPKQANRLMLFEIALFTFGIISLGAWSNPNDPFMVELPFPWLWLAPTLLGLRYGTLAAFGSIGLIAGSWSLWDLLSQNPNLFPAHFFMGGLILSLIAGEFADVWIVRLKRVREANAYLNERLESLTRRHYLLKLSHERLEQDMLTKPMTLRDSIMHIREIMVTGLQDPSALPHANAVMHLLAQTCQLEVAALYPVNQGKVNKKADASIGTPQELDLDDALLTYALEKNELSHLQTESLQNAESHYLVVAPLIATNQQCLGVLVVERMPFLSLNQETLQFLGVLLGYYADNVKLIPLAMKILRDNPTCPIEFASELLRLERVQRESGLPSSITAFVISESPHRQDIFAEMVRQRRQMDISWDIRLSDRDIIITMMPLHGNAAVTGYLLRSQKWLKEMFNAPSFSEAKVTPYTALVNERPAADLLNKLLERCLVKQHS